ncbi:MAG: hypothetical protein FPO08_04880 [Geobacter sp.]|nr:MAG: hypothetical protein FPO08_04880 [Geobacter sp.]
MHRIARSALLTVIVLSAFTANGYALTGLNQCGPGIAPPLGLRCSRNQLLLGYRNAAGACLWVCCTPNSDGRTYDCSGDPVPSDYKMDLRKVQPRPWKNIFNVPPVFEKEE